MRWKEKKDGGQEGREKAKLWYGTQTGGLSCNGALTH